MEYEREGVFRSEGKREYLVLGSQELLENSREKEISMQNPGSLMRRLISDYIVEIGM